MEANMKREWMDSPKFEAHTSYGTVYCTVTDAKHVYVDANSNGKSLEYRGRRYNMTFHLGLYDDSPSFQLWRDSRAIYGCDVPPTYKAKITEAVLVAVNAHLRRHPALLVEAQRVSINNDLCRVESDVEELSKKLAEVNAKRAALISQLEAL
jgi:hypothetical protein